MQRDLRRLSFLGVVVALPAEPLDTDRLGGNISSNGDAALDLSSAVGNSALDAGEF